MIDSLSIKNYKIFKDFQVEGLKRINLIGGRNNTGKSIILEALRILASEGEEFVFSSIVNLRDDWDKRTISNSYESFFHNRTVQLNSTIEINHIKIGTKLKVQGKNKIILDRLALTLDGSFPSAGLSSKLNDKIEEKIVRLSKLEGILNPYIYDSAIVIPANINYTNYHLWNNIDLTEKKDKVIEIVQIIEPNIVDIGIGQDNVARIRMDDLDFPIPLKNLGEGTFRLLTLAIALVSAKDNYLLIDEFEIGLHYSIQEQLWEVIFKVAKELNVQVFVTTHSRDSIQAFSDVMREGNNEEIGKYFRLSKDRVTDAVKAVDYPNEILETALQENFEMR